MIDELMELWKQLMDGSSAPSGPQFRIWTATHRPEVLREAIIRTATKNAKLNGQMDFDYRVKFCSRVANDLTFKGIVFKKASAA